MVPKSDVVVEPETIETDGKPRDTALSAAEQAMAESDSAAEEALALDADINAKIREFSKSLALSYYKLGRALSEMQASKGYLRLDPSFKTWEEYLASKKDIFGRTYCSYLVKIGKAEGLEEFLESENIGAAQLVEAAKLAKPEKIVALLTDARADIDDHSARKTADILKKRVKANPGTYRNKPPEYKGANRPGKAKAPWDKKIERQWKAIRDKDPEDAAKFVDGVRKWLAKLETTAARKAKK